MISLIHPSRSRPKKSFDNAIEWIFKSGVSVELIVSLDSDDPKLFEYFALYEGYEPITNPNTCVVEAANHAAKAATGDILIYLSDDFKCPDNWGVLIEEQFKNVTEPLLLQVDDKLQKLGKDVLTIPIMNRQLYERLGYIFHPAYKSMWCDVDLYHTVRNINALKLCPELVFPHEHYCNGKAENDETYRRSANNWNQGLAVYKERQRANFPI
jgi:hypothetical protein